MTSRYESDVCRRAIRRKTDHDHSARKNRPRDRRFAWHRPRRIATELDILTYYATSTSSTSLAVPVIGGIGLSYGGYCHATFQIKNGVVTQILYSGEKNALLAPSAYCAPILETCLTHLEHMAP
jgi:hypothetical protein